MFAWVYIKTLDDGKDYWCVGTGGLTGRVNERQEKFYSYIRKHFNLHGEIVKKEGYSTNVSLTSKDRIWLGQNNILMIGDAAGFIDMTRGLGMDAAALSGRLAAESIVNAETGGGTALEHYSQIAKKMVNQTRHNQSRGITHFSSNEELLSHMIRTSARTGLGFLIQSFLNKFRKPQNLVFLPP